MDELFGIPTNQLTLALLGVFAAEVLILASLAARDRISFRMAARNVPRRKVQSALIITGLMLATVLFSAAFTTGETLTNSLRTQALENIGQVDVVVKAEQPESRKRPIRAKDISTRSWPTKSGSVSRTKRASSEWRLSPKRVCPLQSQRPASLSRRWTCSGW